MPALLSVQPVNFTTHAFVSDYYGETTVNKDYGEEALASSSTYAAGADARVDTQYSVWTTGDVIFHAFANTEATYAAPDQVQAQNAAVASDIGDINVVSAVEPATNEVTGEKLVVRVSDKQLQGIDNYTANYTVDGQQNFTGYVLSHVGDGIPVSLNAQASSSWQDAGESKASVQFDMTPFASASQFHIINGADDIVYEGSDLTIYPKADYFSWDGADKPIFRFDLNNDGAWDCQGNVPTVIPWSLLTSLGLDTVGQTYTYRVSGEWRLNSLGINDSFTSEGTGQFTVKPPQYRSENFDVTSPMDLNPSGQVFGPYLPGVSLSVPFTMTLDRNGPAPTHMGCVINGQIFAGTRVSASDPYVWKVNVNMGQFGKSKTGLVDVTFAAIKLKPNFAYDTLGYFNGKFDITKVSPDFELQVQAASGAGARVDNNQARLIKGISADMKFFGHFNNVPVYYHSMLGMSVGGYAGGAAETDSDESATVTMTRDVSGAAVPKLSTTAHIGNRLMPYFGDAPEDIRVIPKPTWFVGAAATFDPLTGKYRFDNGTVTLAPPQKTPLSTRYSWLNSVLTGLHTAQRLTAILDLQAPIDASVPVEWDGSKLRVQASVLGTLIWDQVYGGSDLAFGGGLDSWKLVPAGMALALANPVELGSNTILGRPFTITQSVPINGRTLRVTLRYPSGITGTISGNAGIELNWVNNHAEWDPTGTFFSAIGTLSAAPSVVATASATGGWLTNITATGTAHLTLNLAGTTRYRGATGLPAIAPNSDYRAWLDGDYSYVVDGNLVGGAPFEYDSLVENPTGGKFSDVALFKFA